MPTEPTTVRLQLDPDPRLAAAVGGVARYLADATSLETEAVGSLQSTVIAACEEAFQNLQSEQAHLDVSFTRFADRIEVALSHRGVRAPAGALDKTAGIASQLARGATGASATGGVDRVQFETHGDTVVTRLTKYISADSPRSKAT